MLCGLHKVVLHPLDPIEPTVPRGVATCPPPPGHLPTSGESVLVAARHGKTPLPMHGSKATHSGERGYAPKTELYDGHSTKLPADRATRLFRIGAGGERGGGSAGGSASPQKPGIAARSGPLRVARARAHRESAGPGRHGRHSTGLRCVVESPMNASPRLAARAPRRSWYDAGFHYGLLEGIKARGRVGYAADPATTFPVPHGASTRWRM